VTARTLLILFDSIYLVALAAWLGAILFVSFGLAPIIFKVLDGPNAAKFVRAMFPRYYVWGATAGAIALPAVLGGPLAFPADLRGPIVGLQAGLILAGILIMLYCGNSLTPAINAARDRGPDQAAHFSQLHRRSVWLNGLAMLICVALVVLFVLRPTPKSSGILELSPQERAEKSIVEFSKRQAAFEKSQKLPGNTTP
jgi:multisubunit Na+/H+ antiporter MnhB subunit